MFLGLINFKPSPLKKAEIKSLEAREAREKAHKENIKVVKKLNTVIKKNHFSLVVQRSLVGKKAGN